MKCPKCGYTSFDYLESCKKCGKDLADFKQRFGITSVLFPGQLQAEEAVAETQYDEATADAAVAAATGAAAGAATGSTAEESESESDDFGFDFMGDSTEEDDLSFDELFEDAPEDEDVEETIEGPQKGPATEGPADEARDFSFDLPEDDENLADDFGFDPSSDEADEDFAFQDDEDTGSDEDQGTKEDPKSPFDLPESPAVGGAPESEQFSFSARTAAASAGLEAGLTTATEEAFPDPEAAPAESAASEAAVAFGGPFQTAAEASADQPTALSAADTDRQEPEVLEEIDEPFIPFSAPSTFNRLGAFLCDLVVLVVVGLSFIVAAEAAITSGDQRWLPSLTTLIDLSIPYFLVLFSLAFGYFTLFHFLAGQTPGKMLAGLRVEATSGEALSLAEAFLRSVGGLIQMLPLGLGHLSIFLYTDRRGWNDRLAATRVVKAEK